MSGKWSLFLYQTMDYRAAEERLNQWGAEGWRLKKIYFGTLARFEQEGQNPVSYCVDLAGGTIDGENPEYLQLCEDAGWEQVANVRAMSVFASKPGARPVPLQTDPELEERNYFYKHALKNWIAGVVCLVVLAVLLALIWNMTRDRSSLATMLLKNDGLVWVLILFLSVPALVVDFWAEIAYFLRCRRSVRGGRGMPTPSQTGARFRGVIAWIPRLLQYVLLITTILSIFTTNGFSHTPTQEELAALRETPIVMAEDLGVDKGPTDSVHLREGGSVLVQYQSYEVYWFRQNLNDAFTCDTYHCQGTGVARLLSRLLLRDLREGVRRSIFPRKVEMEFTELGFDQAWIGHTGNTDYLLLRQGSTVAFLEAETDLTSPDSLAVIWERLQLGGEKE